MIRSMTGYGKGRAAEGDLAATAEVRSVNNRGREIRFRLPQELFSCEDALRAQANEAIARGRVDATIAWEGAGPAAPRCVVNVAAAKALRDAWVTLQRELGLEDPPTAQALLRLPGVVEPAPAEAPDIERCARVAAAALGAALAVHADVRAREGAKLAEDLSARRGTIVRLVGEIEERLLGATERLADEMRARVKQLLGETPLDEQRLAQEIALAAQKADVTEERVRLRAHLQRLGALFAEGAEEIGRDLEFLVQEIRREVNTLSAKTSDPEIDARSLAIRAELERIREQAANLE